MQRNKLNKNLLQTLSSRDNFVIPDKKLFDLPEKVLQFGTGVLLRGLPDYYIDEANRKGIFKGRTVVVKTTALGSLLPYAEQDCLYSICMRGKVGGQLVDKTYINASISRVLNAQEDWNTIRDFAISPNLELVISNTTEVGIVYHPERIDANMPSSFPGKLLALLHHRYLHFKGDIAKGLVILPAELVEYNGDKLRDVLSQLIVHNELGQDFINWFNAAVVICNTLVDRIVPGKLPESQHKEKEITLGYIDELMISCEPFGLWVIESNDERVKTTVGFADAEAGCQVVPSIHKYKELKLRMLNATHTFSCALSILAGMETVKQSMADDNVVKYLHNLLFQEISETIIGDSISEADALAYGQSVLDRFSNPFLDHRWESISAQYLLKLQVRCIPLIKAYYLKFHKIPNYMLLGLSAYFVWNKNDSNNMVDLLSDTSIWGSNLNEIPGLSPRIIFNMNKINEKGVFYLLFEILKNV
jgi:tagaturonate reductase